MRLSVVIPTYGRPIAIVSRVRQLLPQLTEGVELVIIDNASPLNVEILLQQEVPESIGKIRHIRNSANVGANANICRCFEVGFGQWLWLLGDDDDVNPSAISIILQEIEQVSDESSRVGGFNFSTSIYQYPERLEIHGINDYWAQITEHCKFSNTLFISSCVYRMAPAREFLKIAYHYCYTCAPQMVVGMSMVVNGFTWVKAPGLIVSCTEALPSEKWNSFVVLSGLPALMEVPGCSKAVAENIGPGLEHVLWSPFLAGGLGVIFFDTVRGDTHWLIQFEKLRLILKGQRRIKATLLTVLARLCYVFPIVKALGRFVILRSGIKVQAIDGDLGRL